MRDGLKFELLLQLFFALECLSIWKVPRPHVKVNDFKTKEAETLDDLVKPFGKRWEEFKKERSTSRSAMRRTKWLQRLSKILHRHFPEVLLAEEPKISDDEMFLFTRIEDIYKRCSSFRHASLFYRIFHQITKIICSFAPVILLAIALISLSLFYELDTGLGIRLLNIVAALYFVCKLLIVFLTIKAAQKYDNALKEVELVKNTHPPKDLDAIDC